MKYLILIGDGMGDRPIESLGGLTPLAYAKTPNVDFLAQDGQLGLVQTVPQGLSPGSDVAIMSLMGYDPKGVLTGRGPLEALALNVPLSQNDLAFRLNLVTMEFGEKNIIRNHASGDIPSDEAKGILDTLKEKLPLKIGQAIHQGFSYRNVFVWPNAPDGLADVPPHDNLDKPIDHFLNDPAYRPIAELVRASWEILADHPTNRDRLKRSLPPANSIWLWGQGKAPNVKSYLERWGLKGATVSAVDIIKGLGLATGLAPLKVPGSTGTLNTDYEGKVKTALEALTANDLVLVHLEAPDECSHQGNLQDKIKAIENFDALIVGPIIGGLKKAGYDYRLIVACDHYTPLELRTHSSDPVPFILYDPLARPMETPPPGYSELAAKNTGLFVPDGPALGRLLFGPEKE
ncbi:MAG: cofactor-independent phosphoglycerate mutase [Deltaproteobacteria bacterium]|jgi:2,3-bisphosphoglycerate-independent phosphoglycerate mutase|nr:cofactor-independent phosphoglycerate mutase [Deltaproteobacteria bacterium]